MIENIHTAIQLDERMTLLAKPIKPIKNSLLIVFLFTKRSNNLLSRDRMSSSVHKKNSKSVIVVHHLLVSTDFIKSQDLLEQSLTLISLSKKLALAVVCLTIMHTTSKTTLGIQVCLATIAFSCDRTDPLASSVCEVFSLAHFIQHPPKQSWQP
jgi:hypothetical protein